MIVFQYGWSTLTVWPSLTNFEERRGKCQNDNSEEWFDNGVVARVQTTAKFYSDKDSKQEGADALPISIGLLLLLSLLIKGLFISLLMRNNGRWYDNVIIENPVVREKLFA